MNTTHPEKESSSTRIGITGHRGLHESTETLIRHELRQALRPHPPGDLVGITCLVDGPDTWFAEAVIEHGGRIEVVLPSSHYRDALPEWHHAAYDRLLGRASDRHTTGIDTDGPQAHMTASEILVGLCDHLLTVWDGQPARSFGGTADVVRYAEHVGVPVRVLWPDGAAWD